MSETVSATAIRFPEVVIHDVAVIQEHYPNIGARIAQLWGSSDLNTYLGTVIFDERGGRQGFAEPTASALFRVYEEHMALVHATKARDIWDAILDQVK